MLTTVHTHIYMYVDIHVAIQCIIIVETICSTYCTMHTCVYNTINTQNSHKYSVLYVHTVCDWIQESMHSSRIKA